MRGGHETAGPYEVRGEELPEEQPDAEVREVVVRAVLGFANAAAVHKRHVPAEPELWLLCTFRTFATRPSKVWAIYTQPPWSNEQVCEPFRAQRIVFAPRIDVHGSPENVVLRVQASEELHVVGVRVRNDAEDLSEGVVF